MSGIPDLVVSAAQNAGLDPSLALAVANQESNFNPNAVSPVGAIGVMQLMPATAAGLGVNPYDVSQNIQGGVSYLKSLLNQFGGDVEKALGAYNWGPGNVSKAIATAGSSWLSLAPAQTQNYVSNILSNSGSATGILNSLTSSTTSLSLPIIAAAIIAGWLLLDLL